METDFYAPAFLIQIEGRDLSEDVTQEIKSFVFEDNERELDLMELTLTARNLQFVDDPLFQEGNEIAVRFGYAGGELSPKKKAVIKDVEYDFPEEGGPEVTLRAYDKGHRLAGRENQKVWSKPPPGILCSEIAEEIAAKHGLRPVVEETATRHLRVAQSNVSDAEFLIELAKSARPKAGGAAGYAFFVQDDELHFRPPGLDEAPVAVLEYFTDARGVLRSFKPATQSQGAKGAGVEAKAVGVDPRKKAPVERRASNASSPGRTVLGGKTYLVDGNAGEKEFEDQESGRVKPSFARSEGFHEEPDAEPAQDEAGGAFVEAEMRQVEATAVTVGIPSLRAKRNVEVRGVGRKFSGVYRVQSVRHEFGESGYSCELKLRRNALGKGAGDNAEDALGRENDAPAAAREEEPGMVRVDADTGEAL